MQMADDDWESAVEEYPVTVGHLEIQDVNKAVQEVSDAILGLKDMIQDLHHHHSIRLDEEYETALQNNLDRINRTMLRIPDSLATILLTRKAEVDAIIQYRESLVEKMRVAEEKTAAADARERDSVADAVAFEQNIEKLADDRLLWVDKKLEDVSTRETLVANAHRAVETRENLVAVRERRVRNLAGGGEAAASVVSMSGNQVSQSLPLPKTALLILRSRGLLPRLGSEAEGEGGAG